MLKEIQVELRRSHETWQTTADIKYALTTNVSTYVKYVNTFVCQNYLCKIDLLRIFVPPARNGYAEHNYLT